MDSGLGHNDLGPAGKKRVNIFFAKMEDIPAGKFLRLDLLPRLVCQSDWIGADGGSTSGQSPVDDDVVENQKNI